MRDFQPHERIAWISFGAGVPFGALIVGCFWLELVALK
jgi:hypothetical protein